MDLGLTYTQQRTKFVGASSKDFFYMRGATVDFADSIFHGVGPAVSLNGMAVTNLRSRSTSTRPASSSAAVTPTTSATSPPPSGAAVPASSGKASSAYTHASDGLFPTGPLGPATNTLTHTATGFTYSLGGGVNYNIYHRFELRAMAHYFVTDLHNGGTNQQRDIQVSAGVNWHFGN